VDSDIIPLRHFSNVFSRRGLESHSPNHWVKQVPHRLRDDPSKRFSHGNIKDKPASQAELRSKAFLGALFAYLIRHVFRQAAICRESSKHASGIRRAEFKRGKFVEGVCTPSFFGGIESLDS